MSARMYSTLREVSNFNQGDKPAAPHRNLPAPTLDSARTSTSSTRASTTLSPQCDRRHMCDPLYCTDVIADIAEMYAQRERGMTRSSTYLAQQVEINEKMRMILVDWLVDVHLKFKLHPESLFLAVDILDRYLAVSRTSRHSLQLVGVTSMLIAAKYEEIFPPEVRECIHISANTYTREDILKMERAICSALQFKFTVPTPFPFLARLLTVIGADETLRHMAFFFLEHAALDYKQLQFLPSQIACAALYLAQLALRREPWGATLQHYGRHSAASFRPCAEALWYFVQFSATTKYQAVRRKYSSATYGDVAARAMSLELPPVEV